MNALSYLPVCPISIHQTVGPNTCKLHARVLDHYLCKKPQKRHSLNTIVRAYHTWTGGGFCTSISSHTRSYRQFALAGSCQFSEMDQPASQPASPMHFLSLCSRNSLVNRVLLLDFYAFFRRCTSMASKFSSGIARKNVQC